MICYKGFEAEELASLVTSWVFFNLLRYTLNFDELGKQGIYTLSGTKRLNYNEFIPYRVHFLYFPNRVKFYVYLNVNMTVTFGRKFR